jgi:hypothetical protein
MKKFGAFLIRFILILAAALAGSAIAGFLLSHH